MPDTPETNRADPRLTLRDHLATMRTILANERTVLAYVRTALSLMAAGAFLVKFIDNGAVEVAGWAMVPAGGLVLALGIRSYRRTRAYLRRVEHGEGLPQDDSR